MFLLLLLLLKAIMQTEPVTEAERLMAVNKITTGTNSVVVTIPEVVNSEGYIRVTQI